jgi:GNAT superfamily N-acetyltransferase
MPYVVKLNTFDNITNFDALSLEHWNSFKNKSPEFKEEFLKSLQVITASLDNVCVGYLFFATFNSPYHSDKWCQVDMYYLCDKHRKQGIGKQMFNLVEKTAKEQGCSKIMSSYNLKQPLDGFYQSIGYLPTHTVVAKEL